mmetsp:Transcript_13243/g.37632  ORF Transcript_13243/g.37632 Transcript_13243/m.37632 type:complete len:256 (+) Transcript_13243:2888-3655(+)
MTPEWCALHTSAPTLTRLFAGPFPQLRYEVTDMDCTLALAMSVVVPIHIVALWKSMERTSPLSNVMRFFLLNEPLLSKKTISRLAAAQVEGPAEVMQVTGAASLRELYSFFIFPETDQLLTDLFPLLQTCPFTRAMAKMIPLWALNDDSAAFESEANVTIIPFAHATQIWQASPSSTMQQHSTRAGSTGRSTVMTAETAASAGPARASFRASDVNESWDSSAMGRSRSGNCLGIPKPPPAARFPLSAAFLPARSP